MTDREFRAKAYRLLVTCGNNGDMGTCIACGNFVASPERNIRHAMNCPVAELLDAGKAEKEPAT